MDRARRAEPYSNATVWTREIARNFAGHLDRLSKVHSCVDSASPKSATHAAHSKSLPLRRAGQVSPLKYDRAVSAHRAPTPEERDEHAVDVVGDGEDVQVSVTARVDGDIALGSGSTRRRRPKALRKIKTVSTRTQLEADHPSHESLGDHHENQRLPDRSADHHVGSPAPGHFDEYLEPQPSATHSRKGPPLDFHKRQEQQRIWQENQALVKRLRNTKPTLSSKEWQKDDKWNQSFLKTQERRRLALQHEMARTLASPHSALIRVKHVVQAPSHLAGRPLTDHGVGDEGGVPVTVIEVTTTQDAKSGRDLRRRRSADEDATKEHRQQSTAANHRRILELRKQRENQRGAGVHREMAQSHQASGGAAITDAGPADELVSVRFTFSREGCREPSTPNGITGQFSPAVELEAALEASCQHDRNGNDEDDALLLPVPILEVPLTSRMDTPDENDGGNAVFSALQACIDAVVTAAERTTTTPDGTVALDQPASPLSIAQGDPLLQEHAFNEVCDARFDTLGSQPSDKPDRTAADETPDTVEFIDTTLKQDFPVSKISISHDPNEANTEAVDSTEVMVQSARQLAPPHGMEASGYGSEFEAEESSSTTAATTESPVVDEPVATAVVTEMHPEDDHDDEYEDDHAEEEDEEKDLSPTLNASGYDDGGGGTSAQDDDADPQYDDDLEPETHDEEEEHSYGDDGFSD